MRKLKVEILRIEAGREKATRFEEYEIEEISGMSVLALLQKIQAENDPTVYFDAVCRSSICGSCAMMINGKPALACKTQTAGLPEKIKLEPLIGFPVIGDLAVDKAKFFSELNREKIKGWIHPKNEFNSKQESLMSDESAEKIYKADRCVECGICVSGCLSARMNKDFHGAAGLNKISRFVLDPRDERKIEDMPSGGQTFCHGIGNCENLCPKEIELSEQIGTLRRKALWESIKKIFKK